jgi:hypothetical protein
VVSNVIQWKGKQLIIGEAWIEKQTEPAGFFLPFYKTIPGYHLCFNLSQGWEVLNTGSPPPFFVLENLGRGFLRRGNVILCEQLDTIKNGEMTVQLTDNWKCESAATIKMTPMLQQSAPSRR